MTIISIDGNIGCGKSTLVHMLKTHGEIITERISEWPLTEFYNDPSRWALALQIKILQTMGPPNPTNDAYIFHERCLQSSNHVFWRHLLDTNQVTDIEDEIYQDAFQKYEWSPDTVIYLRCSPEKCFKNIQKRTQTGDSSITFEYLKSIHDTYEEFINMYENVIVLDVENLSENEVYKIVCNMLECHHIM
jgi:deoxyadenosine/deoxycytidine kinase